MITFTGTCIFTHDVARLREFYRAVLEVEPEDGGEFLAAFPVAGAVLSVFSTERMEELAAGSTGAGGGFSLEFAVDDPDAAYEKLLGMGARILKEPTTHPWGRRALWFCDPDGNMISFYKQVA
jgi:catechol 2,3-dioxygenase-like lactoylglutathione lyase family enzyme